MIQKLLEPFQKAFLLLALYWRTDYKGNWAMSRLGMWVERMIERWKR